MAGSIFGKHFQISTWGESHGKALGVVIDGCPAGISLSEEDIQKDLDRRKPGQSPFSTPRKESDKVEILSGVFEGKTTGTPISLIVYNTNQRSYDYSEIAKCYRPGHADFTYDEKYGFRDYRGGGRSSGRETTARVAAGAIAKKILAEFGVDIMAYTLSIGPVSIDPAKFKRDEIFNNFLAMPDQEAAEKAAAYLHEIKEREDSAGGMIECVVNGLPSGVGEPVFEKLDAMLGKAILSIGAVKGVEFGSGFNAARMTGWENNDFFQYDEEGHLTKLSNNAGGIVGGISDGFPIVFRAAIKPTSSIHRMQKTVNKAGQNIELQVEGRHDPIIVPRAVIVVEAMTALTLVDYLFERIFSRIDLIKKALL
ncbi:MAG: chorismate synthase [Epulopiscium sp.]|jgi:chorismate synthase|uniref:Chorismate synthase n=1 Tax=Defluviitalea raffinosedens TaxID=1450156 RepID=A0A7C8HEM3_9FIRM|nr:chorismate synthase [Defluviitalea raffinosedens]MBZ4668894.1 chorismate synthase [Defluviitaleaceae bacterium]MDK2787069.1 chorismate synthase [Candidatus Epulonipiscium sp.]KAE9634429.1 chorismate synthase [Defluviitalea raffinosedens]MBM7684777.1 chorismate synthase [Defluviitalea raffinosedens]HHW67007.1 chorismate synthase [Candidatus Epulonipiscium sp.]